jgi:hypothetical protein
LEKEVLKVYDALQSDSFPDVIRIASYQSRDKNENEVLVWMDTIYDPVCMSKDDFRLLHRMNGLKMSEAMKYISKELLQKLFDAGVLE